MYNVSLLCNNNIQILGGIFMASQQTPNYRLSRWAGTDRILVEEFNDNWDKIDAALKSNAEAITAVQAAVPKIVFGTYIGDGADSRTIPLGFTPKAVLVTTAYGAFFVPYDTYGGLALENYDAEHGNKKAVHIIANGFTVYHASPCLVNANNTRYHYMAIG